MKSSRYNIPSSLKNTKGDGATPRVIVMMEILRRGWNEMTERNDMLEDELGFKKRIVPSYHVLNRLDQTPYHQQQ